MSTIAEVQGRASPAQPSGRPQIAPVLSTRVPSQVTLDR